MNLPTIVVNEKRSRNIQNYAKQQAKFLVGKFSVFDVPIIWIFFFFHVKIGHDISALNV